MKTNSQKAFHKKKLKLVLFIVLFIALVFTSYIIYSKYQPKRIQNQAIEAIPLYTSWFLEIKKPSEFLQNIKTNPVWRLLNKKSILEPLDKDFNAINDIILNLKGNETPFIPQKAYIASFNTDSVMEHIFLFDVLGRDMEKFINHKVIEIVKSEKKIVIHDFEGSELFKINIKEGISFYYTIHNNVFVGGRNVNHVKNAIIQLKSKQDILKDKYFEAIYKPSGKFALATLFINVSNCSGQLEKMTPIQTLKPLFNTFGAWSGIDIQFDKQNIFFNGFTSSNDSLSNFLTCFIKQKPQQCEIIKLLPENTNFFLTSVFVDFETFYSRFQNYKSIFENNEESIKSIHSFNKKYNCSIKEDFLEWIGKDIAYFETDDQFNPNRNQHFIAFNIIDTSAIKGFMSKVTIASKGKIDKNTNYDGKIPSDLSFLKMAFFPLLEHFDPKAFFIFERYLFIAEDQNAAQLLLQKISSNQLWLNNTANRALLELFPSETNLFVYKKLPHFDSNKLEDSVMHLSKDTSLDKLYLNAIMLQLNTDNNLFYTNIVINTKSKFQDTTTTLWELNTDTNIRHIWGIPELWNSQNLFFAFDINNNLYAVSNSGNLLWKRHFSLPLLSSPIPIDYYKNGETQFVLNTEDSIYVLNNSGNDIGEYPLYLTPKATAPITVFDYDNTTEYRFLIPKTDASIANLDKNGNHVKGWEFSETKNHVSETLQHFIHDKKDYIVIKDNKGQIYITDRKGNSRFKKPINYIASKNPFYLISINDEKYIITIDDNNDLTGISLKNGEEKKFSSKKFDKNKSKCFLYNDTDKQTQVLVIVDNSQITIIDLKGKKEILKNTELKDNCIIQFIPRTNGFTVSFTDTAANTIILYESEHQHFKMDSLTSEQLFLIEKNHSLGNFLYLFVENNRIILKTKMK